MYTLTNTALLIKLQSNTEQRDFNVRRTPFICAGSSSSINRQFHTYPENFQNTSATARNAVFESLCEVSILPHLKSIDYFNSCVFIKLSNDPKINNLKAKFDMDKEYEVRGQANPSRYYNHSPIAREDFVLEHTLYAMNLKRKNSWKAADGTLHVSYFPKAFIKNFRKKLMIQEPNFIFSSKVSQEKMETSQFFKLPSNNGQAVELSEEFTISNGEYSIHGLDGSFNNIADLVHFSKIPQDIRISYIEFSNCSRGAKDISHKFTTSLTPPKNAYSFFIYEKHIKALVELDGELVEQELVYYGLGTFSQLKTFNKYKKFLTYFRNFSKSIKNYEGSFLLNPSRYEEEIKKIYQRYSKYWKKIPSYMDSFDTSNFSEVYSNTTYPATNMSLEAPSINGLGVLSTFTNVPSYRKINNLKQAILETTQAVEKKEASIRNRFNLTERHTSRLEVNQQRLIRIQQEIDEQNSKYKTLEKEWNQAESYLNSGIKETIGSMRGQLEKCKLKYEEDLELAITESYDSSYGGMFIQNLKESGISIDNIDYRFVDSGTIVNTNSDPELVVKAKKESMLASPNLILNSISFTIQKPVIIRVDYAEKGENCKKIVGGPYCVELTQRQLLVGLLTSNSLHGTDGRQVWVHPHTSSFNVNSQQEPLKALARAFQRACLGEASAPIFKAFQSADPKMAIYAAMAWITSANSSDAWGRYWKHFPTVDSIHFEESNYEVNKQKRIFEEKLKSTEQIVSNFISPNFSQGLTTTNEDQSVSNTVEQLIENEINPPNPILTNQAPEEDPYSTFTEYVPFVSTNT